MGIGTAFPARQSPGDQWGATRAELEQSGFEHIRVAESAAETPALLVEAGKAALADAGYAPRDIDTVLVARAGSYMHHDAGWLSLMAAQILEMPDPWCLDVKGAGCSGFLQLLDLAAPLLATGRARRVLALGGGASGYLQRWLPTVGAVYGGDADAGILTGDAAFAAVLAADGGPFQVLASEVATDPSFGASVYCDGSDHLATSDAERGRWLEVAPTILARVAFTAISRAGLVSGQPLFFCGTNSGRYIKSEIYARLAPVKEDKRHARALAVQLEQLRELGHLFGGDTVCNLRALRDADVLRSGDHILCAEAGNIYFYSASVLRVA